MEAYLNFNGNAAEALAFYAKCLDGEITFRMTFGESPMAGDVPADAQNRLMHARLTARGHRLMASDTPPGYPFEGHKGFSLSLQTQDDKEGQRLFKALSEGGQVTMPYQPTFWAKGFGMLVDKFGVPWMINCEEPQTKS